jgi:hypothetical protein
MTNPFDVSPADLQTPASLGTQFSAPVMKSTDVFNSCVPRGDISGRVDRRGGSQPRDVTADYHSINDVASKMRGPVQRRIVSREEALTARAAQGAAQPAITQETFHALQVELAAERELRMRQDEQLQQLLERLDALEGGGA